MNLAKSILRAAAVALAVLTLSPASFAQNKSVRVVIPYAPGGAVDLVGRAVANKLGEVLNQTVFVDNKPGAGAMVGTEFVAHAPGDGLTLLVVDPSIAINPTLQTKAPFKLADFKAVSLISASPLVLTVNPSLPITDLPSLIAYAKNNKGGLNFASAGVGTTPHMAGELLKLRSGIDITHVPYKGSGPAMADLVAGHIQMAFSSGAAAAAYIGDNRLRGIATSGSSRAPVLPNLPTVAEAGIKNFEVLFWTALYVPSSTPDAVVEKLNEAVKAVLTNADLVRAFDKSGEVPTYTSSAQANAFTKAEFEKWAGVIKDAKLQP